MTCALENQETIRLQSIQKNLLLLGEVVPLGGLAGRPSWHARSMSKNYQIATERAGMELAMKDVHA